MTRTSCWDILQRLKRHPASSLVLPAVLASMDKALHCERYTPRPAYSMQLAAFKLQLLTRSPDASAQIVCQVSPITFTLPSFSKPKHCLAAHISKACTASSMLRCALKLQLLIGSHDPHYYIVCNGVSIIRFCMPPTEAMCIASLYSSNLPEHFSNSDFAILHLYSQVWCTRWPMN